MIIIIELFFYKEINNNFTDTLYIELRVNGLVIGQLSNDRSNVKFFDEINPNFSKFSSIKKIEAYEVVFNDRYCERLRVIIKKIDKKIRTEEIDFKLRFETYNFFLQLNIQTLFLKELKKLLEGDDVLVGDN